MNLPQYPVTHSANFATYFFTTTGKNGTFQIIVQFTLIPNTNICNLGFGVLNPDSTIDDTVVINNDDMLKILASVANTVYTFTSKYKEYAVAAKGSTVSRTRLYHRMLTTNFESIEKDFFIYGILAGKMVSFKKEVEYEAYAVIRK